MINACWIAHIFIFKISKKIIIQIPIQTSENCQNVYQGNTITNGMICAGNGQQTVCNVRNKESLLTCLLFESALAQAF